MQYYNVQLLSPAYNQQIPILNMGKKRASAPTKAPSSTAKKTDNKISKPLQKKKLKNKNKNDQQQDQIQQSQISDEDDSKNESDDSQQNSDGEEDSQNQDSEEESSSITPVKPENYALRQMQFRANRGTKMNYLMNRKKQEQQDPFWAQHKGYFGDLNADDDQQEQDYVESSSGKDQFDSDFGQTQSQHEDQPDEKEKKMTDELDEDKEKQKKKRAQLMKKINAYKQKPQKISDKIQQKPKNEIKVELKQKKSKTQIKPHQQIGNRFIHQIFTQQQLLGEAAHTQYYNWLSLKKLISIETEKKDFTRKVKHVDGNKIIFKDRRNQNGSREISYELCGVAVNHISDLTKYWEAK